MLFTTFFCKKITNSQIHKPSLQCLSILNMNSLKNNNKMETKVVSFEQMPEISALPTLTAHGIRKIQNNGYR